MTVSQHTVGSRVGNPAVRSTFLRPARIVADAPLFAAALFGVCVLLAVIVVLVDWIARLLTK